MTLALTALKLSIEAWEQKLVHLGPVSEIPVGTNACPLCEVFRFGKIDCEGCPIAEKGHSYCEGTPYDLVVNARRSGSLDAFRRAARKEIEFLKSMLPESTNTGE